MANSLLNLVNELKEFINVNAKMDMITKNGKRVELNTKIVHAVFNTRVIKII